MVNEWRVQRLYQKANRNKTRKKKQREIEVIKKKTEKKKERDGGNICRQPFSQS